jgi:oxygen-dependent protoporphyrinogen oxidase
MNPSPPPRTDRAPRPGGTDLPGERLDLLVLGGGVSGLAVAWEARQRRPGWKIRVLEGNAEPGGTMRSERVEGCLCEWGPNGFLTNVPHTRELAERLGLGDRLLPADDSAADRFLYVRGALRPVPMTPGAFFRSDLLSPRGRARVLLEPFQGRAPAGTEDTVATFAARRLGSEAASVLVDPMVSGIYAGDPSRLCLRAVFPKMAEMERDHGSLVRAMIARRRERRRRGDANGGGGPAGPGGTLTSFDEGMEVLVRALAEALGPDLLTGVRAVSAAPDDDGFAVTADDGGRTVSLAARRVVCALPAYGSQAVLEAALPRLGRELGGIPYAGITVVTLIYNREQIAHPLHGFGFLVPFGEGPRMLGAIWTGSIFPSHVTPGRVLLRVMVGGARDPEAAMLPEGKTVDWVHDELARILGGIEGMPETVRLYRHPRGIPQYETGHLQRLAALDRELESVPGLHLAGNAYRGIGVNDCVREAAVLADRLCAEDEAVSPARGREGGA